MAKLPKVEPLYWVSAQGDVGGGRGDTLPIFGKLAHHHHQVHSHTLKSISGYLFLNFLSLSPRASEKYVLRCEFRLMFFFVWSWGIRCYKFWTAPRQDLLVKKTDQHLRTIRAGTPHFKRSFRDKDIQEMKTGYLMIEGTDKKRDQHLRTIRGGMVVGGWSGKKKKQIGPSPIQGD